MQMAEDSSDWELNPAADAWPLAARFGLEDWRRLADAVRRGFRQGEKEGELAALGVAWRAVSIEGGVLAWLAESPTAAEARHRSDRRAAMAARFAGFGVWEHDLVTGERHWDEQMFRLRGIDPGSAPDATQVSITTTTPEGRASIYAAVEDIARMVREDTLPENYVTPTVEFQVIWPDGTRRWLSTRGNLVREPGRHPRLLGLHWDINDNKMAQELRREREAAEAASRAKSRFLADMSHEIRTPMNAILGTTHLALQTGHDPRQRGYLETIERSAAALLRIINDILDFSKIEAGKIDIEHIEFSLAETFDDLANLVGLQAGDKELELVFALSPTLPARLVGDPLRIGQVLVNLVSNAIKFTERGGEVVLTVEPLSRVGHL